MPCGMPALGVRALPNRYELAADNVLLLDGRQPVRGDAMICGACGQPVVSQWLFAAPGAQPITV